MKRRSPVRHFLLSVLVMALAGPIGCTQAEVQPAAVDFMLPELLAGSDVRLTDFEGDVVILNFWTSWCGPCRVEIPELMMLQRRYKDRGMTMIGVVMDEPDGARKLARDLDINYTNVVGSDELAESIGGVHSFPTTVILDRSRTPILRFSGMAPTRALEQEILAALGQPG